MPPNPNELTPAARGLPSSVRHWRNSRLMYSGDRANAKRGLRFSQCSEGGSAPWCTARIVFTAPAIPAAESRWPILVFTLPTAHGRGPRERSPSTVAKAFSSIGSPIMVPVPCASIYDSASGDMPAVSRAAVMTSICARILGVVMPIVCPSLPIAEPRSTA